jgi:hypothetical protein
MLYSDNGIEMLEKQMAKAKMGKKTP